MEIKQELHLVKLGKANAKPVFKKVSTLIDAVNENVKVINQAVNNKTPRMVSAASYKTHLQYRKEAESLAVEVQELQRTMHQTPGWGRSALVIGGLAATGALLLKFGSSASPALFSDSPTPTPTPTLPSVNHPTSPPSVASNVSPISLLGEPLNLLPTQPKSDDFSQKLGQELLTTRQLSESLDSVPFNEEADLEFWTAWNHLSPDSVCLPGVKWDRQSLLATNNNDPLMAYLSWQEENGYFKLPNADLLNALFGIHSWYSNEVREYYQHIEKKYLDPILKHYQTFSDNICNQAKIAYAFRKAVRSHVREQMGNRPFKYVLDTWLSRNEPFEFFYDKNALFLNSTDPTQICSRVLDRSKATNARADVLASWIGQGERFIVSYGLPVLGTIGTITVLFRRYFPVMRGLVGARLNYA
ncbi:MAG TPA: hypothetical protein VLE95_01445 [Chlamydiales bacterium]|nr:hypothetical protein [Chlamydiales bacterium]